MSTWHLYFIMARIGLFTFGGGYAMIPLFQQELVERHGLISGEEFVTIVAIAQMTPGPIAMNAATYVGFHHGGVTGALAATMGLLTPSLLIISLLAHGARTYSGHPAANALLRGIRPVIVGMIASALLFFIDAALVTGSLPWVRGLSPAGPGAEPLGVNRVGVLIFAVALILRLRYRWGVFRILLACALLGAASTLLPG